MFSLEKKTSCDKTTDPGVTTQAWMLARDLNKMLSELSVGTFATFDKSDDKVEPTWIEKIRSNQE